ncbi:glycoside hydrolase family 38 C-terminal domain-containing protein [Proteiniclasticum ruminis]|uniref:Mannosylglycerate hydrolase n=1 Tax=Proteiniclasticum ruminis TaxID=398199 RepID=A0A1I5C7S3_9CLOT|nr:glycoside hydrolase family 38 C-terminal domain-containing protein [Proteiniclasticum ruminis]SFN82852.1 mannosylglycerate hydrolase [Proteiniclasticum ruminis]
MKEKLKIVIFPHTHWDREWYFTSSKSMIYSLKDFDEIIEFLEKDEEIGSFILDGQTSILEDYIALHPYMLEPLKKLVKERRLMTGPWYTQPDTLVVSGESIIRNLLYGTRQAREYGHSMEIGYLPDSFGMSEQMPQIYNGFGIRYAMFRRGIADSITKDREFYWESKDGSRVFTHNIYHYGSMAYPPNDTEGLKRYLDEMIELLGPSSTTGTLILFNGEDQKPIRKNLFDIVKSGVNLKKDLNIVIGQIENVMKSMEESDTDFMTYQGEFTWGQHSRVHKSIFSTRADLKSMNNTLENFIVNSLEPICSLAYISGFVYEEKLMEKIWKLMLDNSAHDSIGMCNSDRTNVDVEHRFITARNLAEDLMELKLREIGMNIQEKNVFQFQLYNLLPSRRDGYIVLTLFVPCERFEVRNRRGELQSHEVISIKNVTEEIRAKSVREIGVDDDRDPQWNKEEIRIYEAEVRILVKDMVPLGYETYEINPVLEVEEDSEDEERLLIDKSILENEFYKISVNPDGKIDLLDKRALKQWSDFLKLENSGDEGDTYDYSEPEKDMTIREFEVENIETEITGLVSRAVLKLNMDLPYNLLNRAEGIRNIRQPIRLTIELRKNDEHIHIDLSTMNAAIEHRMRLIVNTDIEAKCSVADQQFGLIERPVYLEEVENWKENGWNEKPRTIEPMQSFVSISNEENTVAVFTENVREYQVTGDKYNEIAMTVYRSTPYLGKDNLNDRPGRESGTKSATPDAALIGKCLSATYTVTVFNGTVKEHVMSQTAKEILTPVIGYQAAQFKNNTNYFVLNIPREKKLSDSKSLLESNSRVVLSTVKKAEGKDNILIRFFNPSSRNVEELDIQGLSQKKLCEVRLDETRAEMTEFTLKPCEVKTYSID